MSALKIIGIVCFVTGAIMLIIISLHVVGCMATGDQLPTCSAAPFAEMED